MSSDADKSALRDHQAWLGYLQPDGLVVSPAALVDAQVILNRSTAPLQHRFLPFLREEESGDGDVSHLLADLPAFLRDFLEWPADLIDGVTPERPIPESLTVPLREFGETLLPSFALRESQPADPAHPWLLLVQSLPPRTDLDATPTGDDTRWNASPSRRFERLLRETRVPIGLLSNGTQLRLLYAPQKENSGSLTFPIAAMAEVAGRPILAAFHALLNRQRLLAVPTPSRLPAVLQRSRDYQSTVSILLAEQVLHALYDLLRGFQAADERAKGELLRSVVNRDPDEIYGGLISVLLRLVFILFAEDRGLLPGGALYVRNYAVHGLFERLRADAERYPDTMDHRYGAWAQLLALFRAIHRGSRHPRFQMPSREGHLFDPDRFPFLEGRESARAAITALPLVSDGTLYRVLHKLLLLDGERLSYRTLDVEEIGSVYQTIMGFCVEVAAGTSIALKGKRKHGSVPAAPVVNLEALLAIKPADRGKWLKEQADTAPTEEGEKALKSATCADDLLAALDKKIDRQATPAPVPRGGLVLQPTDERRRSGSHYTPRSFTKPIVEKTLEPILRRLGETPRPEQILELKIADIAVGSAAFLVESCRQLGDALVSAWAVHGGRPPVPPDETEELLATRLVAQRCLYGVDRNHMAVDLAKLSLWLATLAKDHPFTFLDHSIRSGDSLVGLTRRQIETFTWRSEFTTGQFFEKDVRDRVKAALRERQALLAVADDFTSPQLKKQKLAVADERLDLVRSIGDAAIAAYFSADKDKAREQKRLDLADRFGNYLAHGDLSQRPTAEITALRGGRFPVIPFHWEIEFPEVFDRENPGFDGIVGNPPFLGGSQLSAMLGGPIYQEWLKACNEGAFGNGDLAAYFFRRAYTHISRNGTFGFLATKTISEGGTRITGLRSIVASGGRIYNAIRSQQWPGEATVLVAVVHIAAERVQDLPVPLLDGERVAFINSRLQASAEVPDPVPLSVNATSGFFGTKLGGSGFILSVDEHARLAEDGRNRQCLIPYLGGEEVNSSPTQCHERYAIYFGSESLDYALQFPELIEIVRARVKPERDRALDHGPGKHGKKYWWQFTLRADPLYDNIQGLPRCLVTAITTAHLAFSFQPIRQVFAHSLVAFAFDGFGPFACLQSQTHNAWAVLLSSYLGGTLRYSVSDAFHTFPFPDNFKVDLQLEAAGREYYEYRAALMADPAIRARQMGGQPPEGLTKTYNRFHDPAETLPGIAELRRLHAAMDAAVLAAYGWTDLHPTCEFLLDYEEEEDPEDITPARRRKKPWRYRWPDDLRDEVLARLLKLNATRAEEERLAGLTAAVKVPKKTKRVATVQAGEKTQLSFGLQTLSPGERSLPQELRLAASQPLLYATNLVVSLLSEAGGSLPWHRLLDAYTLATNPALMRRLCPQEERPCVEAWERRWNEKVPTGLLLPSLNQLGGKSLTLTNDNEGLVFQLLDGPRRPATEDVGYDAWLALRVATALKPDALEINNRDALTEEANELVFV